MSSSAERRACDTSLAIAALDATHVAHRPCRRALLDHRPALGLRVRLVEAGIVEGSVYDALVGQAALCDDRVLFTRDRRAERTYRALGVRYELVA